MKHLFMSITTAHYITPNAINDQLLITHVYEARRVTLRSVLYHLNIH